MIETLYFTIWDREFSLPIEYDCYSGEKVLKSQVKALKAFLKHSDWLEQAKTKVVEYCRDDVEVDEDNLKKDNIFSYIKPKCVYVKREAEKPRIALMCNYRYDEEHGIAIVFDSDGKVTVGIQDIIL